MKPSLCAIANQSIAENLIGTASHYQAYVLIECPMPWAAKVFNSQRIPPALRQYITAVKAKRSVQFLAIDSGISASASVNPMPFTLMVYERMAPAGAALSVNESLAGYQGYEFQFDDLTQVVDCLEAHWQGDRIGQPITQQDILVCTHGMRDRCCARFGQPLFREAARSIQQKKLPNARVWKVSHIGGHRFAPTAIVLPDGRYYGRLTLSALQSVVTRSGPIRQLRSVYRGWGLLPAPLQVLEQQLMFYYGWSWFEHKVTYRMLPEVLANDEKGDHQGESSKESVRELPVEVSVEMFVEPAAELAKENLEDSQATTYRAKLTQDPQKAVCVKASCNSAVETPFVKYTVTECVLVSDKRSSVVTEGASKPASVL